MVNKILYLSKKILRSLENLVGKFKGYGTCPNCGKTLWKKDTKKLYYTGSNGETASLLFCKECFNPCQLDRTKTTAWLSRQCWPPGEVEAINRDMANVFTC